MSTPKAPERTQPLTQLEMSVTDIGRANDIARQLGYTQTAYTSTSALWGVYCLPDRQTQQRGCIVKTSELGFIFVVGEEDLP